MARFRSVLVPSLLLALGFAALAGAPAAATLPGDDDRAGFSRAGGGDDRRTRRASSDTGAAPVDVTDLQVCGADDYDDADMQCQVDSSGESVSTDTLYCTAIVQGAPGDEVSAAVLFDGEETYADRLTLSNRRAVPMAVWVTLGPSPLPRGDWECEITGDASETTTVRTSGPAGDFVHAGVCDSDDAVEVTESTNACPRGDVTSSFDDIESVTCSAVLADIAERRVRLELDYDGTFDVRGREVDGWSDHETVRTSSTVATAYLVVDGASMTRGSRSDLPAGRYTCRWLVDGDERGARSFTVRGA